MTTITQAELARRLGTTRSYITALKNADRLVLANDGAGIDLEASLERIEATRDPQRADVAERHASARVITLQSCHQSPPAAPSAPSQSSLAGAPSADADVETNSYQAARAVKEKYAAKTARLEYERAIGKLIERDSVEAAVEDVMTIVRQHLEQIPHRLAPQLVDQPIETIRADLKQSVRDILTEMTREFASRLKEIQP